MARLLTWALLTASTLVLTECRKASESVPAKLSEREVFLTTSGWNNKGYIEVMSTPAGVVTSTDFYLSLTRAFPMTSTILMPTGLLPSTRGR